MKWETTYRSDPVFAGITRERSVHHLIEGLEQRVMLSVPATPLQSVTTSVGTDGVHFNVTDPQRNRVQHGFESLGTGETASTVLNSNGIVAFSKSWRDSFLALHTDVFYEVYDVQKGAWQEGHQELAAGETIGNLSSSGGVVSWSATSLDYYNSPTVRVFFAVYDAQKGAWQNEREDLAAGEAVTAVQNSGGVVAWSASSRDINSALQQRVFYQVYDPQTGSWHNGDTSLATNETAGTITITNGTVSWTSNVTAYTRGYDPGIRSWTTQASKPLAFFYGGSYIGTPPLTLYLWDMSIGATSWSWSFGDGSTANTTRTPAYTYTAKGIFTLTQTATNSGVSSTQSVTVTTDPVVPTDLALSKNSIAEHLPRGSAVGTFSAVGQGKLTYSLVEGTGDEDNASFKISGAQLDTRKMLDYQKKNSYSIRVRATDKSGLNTENTFTITVLNMFDLSWKSLSVTPASLTELGGAISVKRSYKIADRPAVPDFTIQYHLSTDQVWGNADDIILGGDETITTKGGKSVGAHTKTIKLNVGRIAAGSYNLLTNLDADNTVSENNETNNVLATALQITVPAFGRINGVNKILKAPDIDGDVLKFSLTGRGSAQLTGANLDVLTLTGTDASSVLKITVTKSGGGDGRVTLSGITSDGLMKSITGKAVVVDGDVTLNTLLGTHSANDHVSVTLADLTGVLNTNGLPYSLKLME